MTRLLCCLGLAATCLALVGCPWGGEGLYWYDHQQEICADGIDNNDDGDIDCCDWTCHERSVCFAETECADGLDNDCDGAIDDADGMDCMP